MGKFKFRGLITVAAASFALSACGGTVPLGTSRLPAHLYETTEYNANYGLDAINASSAYAAGGVGRGIRVAVIDTGIDLGHPEFRGAVDPASTDIVSGDPAHLDDVGGHGTMVAGVIGARRNDAHTHGIAFESTILAIRADAPDSCPAECSFEQSDLAAATNHAVAHNSRVINYSLGGTSSLSADFHDALRDATASGAVLVFAAGNEADEGATEPTYPAMFAATADADGHALAVGAVDENDLIADFSNPAGSAKDFYLVAPGVDIVTTAMGGGTAMVSGTSFAAPHVSGAAAVLLDAAPHLSGSQVVDLLLSTATDLGDPGVDEVYGHGLVNLEEALRPQGALSVPTGDNVAASGPTLAATSLKLGAAFGDALADDRLLKRAMFLDGYGRAYITDLAQAVAPHEAGIGLQGWLSPRAAPRAEEMGILPGISARFGYIEEAPTFAGWEQTADRAMDGFAITATPGPLTEVTASRGFGLTAQFGLADQQDLSAFLSGRTLASPFLALAGDGDSLVFGGRGGSLSIRVGITADMLASGTDHEARRAAYVAEVRQDWSGGSHLGVQVGQLVEQGSTLDTVGGGAFLLGARSETLFIGASGSLVLTEGTELFGAYTVGRTQLPASSGGLLRNVSPLWSDALGVGVATQGVFGSADRLALSLSRPLRVVSGSAILDIPVRRTEDGAVIRRTDRVGLAPSGNQLDVELSYRVRVASGTDLQLNGIVQFEPGHAADADPVIAAAAKYRLTF